MSRIAVPTEILIIFYCRTGSAERLALAAAVGAVQARANIRLRRLRDTSAETGSEDLARMCKEYVPPTEADVLRADAIVFTAPANFTTSSQEWTELIQLLKRCGSEGKLDGKVATVLAETEAAQESLSLKVLQLGFITVPSNPQDPTDDGRRVAAVANALKKAESGR